MNRATLESIKSAIRIGIALKGFELLPKPDDRAGYKWVPLTSDDGKTIGWTEIADPDYGAVNDGGDYTRAAQYTVGMNVAAELWYTDGENIWQAVKNGTPRSFDDREYFDIIVNPD